MSRIVVLSCCLAAALSAGWARRADAFCLNSYQTPKPQFSWQTADGKVRYRVSSSFPAEQLDAVKSVFDAWTVQCSTLSFEFVSETFEIADTSFSLPDTDQAEIHLFWVSSELDKDKVGIDTGISKNFVLQDGLSELRAVSIALNAHDYTLSGADEVPTQHFDLRAVLARALGLALGLDQSDQPATSILLGGQFNGGSNADGRAPKADDIDGVQYLYWDAAGECAAQDKPDGPGPSCGQHSELDGGVGQDAQPAGDGGADGSAQPDAGVGDDDDGGCSCDTGDTPSHPAGPVTLLGLLLFGWLRRRSFGRS